MTSETLPDLPSAVAVMGTGAPLSAGAIPRASPHATVWSDVVHTIERPVSTAPFASLTVALACADWPAVRVGTLSATTTDATGTTEPPGAAAVTVTGTVALRPWEFTLMSTVPTPI